MTRVANSFYNEYTKSSLKIHQIFHIYQIKSLYTKRFETIWYQLATLPMTTRDDGDNRKCRKRDGWQDHVNFTEQTVPEKDTPAVSVPVHTIIDHSYSRLGEMH